MRGRQCGRVSNASSGDESLWVLFLDGWMDGLAAQVWHTVQCGFAVRMRLPGGLGFNPGAPARRPGRRTAGGEGAEGETQAGAFLPRAAAAASGRGAARHPPWGSEPPAALPARPAHPRTARTPACRCRQRWARVRGPPACAALQKPVCRRRPPLAQSPAASERVRRLQAGSEGGASGMLQRGGRAPASPSFAKRSCFGRQTSGLQPCARGRTCAGLALGGLGRLGGAQLQGWEGGSAGSGHWEVVQRV